MKYRDDMTPAEREQFARELEQLEQSYARNATTPYRVSWTIDVDARDPIQAARIAWEIHCSDPDAAPFYDVSEYDPTTGNTIGREITVNAETWEIDLFAFNEPGPDQDDELRKAALSRGQP